MSDRFPSKQITLDTHELQLHGISADDAYWNGIHDNFEAEFQRFCRQLIQPDYVCLDIGANIGVKTLFLSRHCPQGRVIAVEAGKSAADCLAANVVANGCSNVIPLHAAAASHDGMLTFEEGSAWGHQGRANGVEVEALTLQTLVARHSLTRVDFIKIDVEGAEFPILQSALSLINEFDSLVHVELNPFTLIVWGNTNPREFVEWIDANFSHFYALNRSEVGEMLTPVTSTDQCQAILHRNLVDDACVTDLVMSNAAHRLEPVPAFLEQQMRSLLAEQRQTQAELSQTQAQLSQTQAQLSQTQAQLSQTQAELLLTQSELAADIREREALLRSSSWRLTAPLRWIKRRGTQ